MTPEGPGMGWFGEGRVEVGWLNRSGGRVIARVCVSEWMTKSSDFLSRQVNSKLHTQSAAETTTRKRNQPAGVENATTPLSALNSSPMGRGEDGSIHARSLESSHTTCGFGWCFWSGIKRRANSKPQTPLLKCKRETPAPRPTTHPTQPNPAAHLLMQEASEVSPLARIPPHVQHIPQGGFKGRGAFCFAHQSEQVLHCCVVPGEWWWHGD